MATKTRWLGTLEDGRGETLRTLLDAFGEDTTTESKWWHPHLDTRTNLMLDTNPPGYTQADVQRDLWRIFDVAKQMAKVGRSSKR